MRAWVVLAIAVLFAPPSVAAGSVSLTTDQVRYDAGWIEGDLASIRYRGDDGAQAPSIRLDASFLSIVSHRTEPGPAGLPVNQVVQRDSIYQGAASLLASYPAANFDLWVAAKGDAAFTLEAPSFAADAHAEETSRQPAYAPVDGGLDDVNVQQTALVSGADTGTATIAGTFTAWLWNWNLTMATGARSVDVVSGSERVSPPSQDPMALQGYRSLVAAIEVENGTLTLTGSFEALKSAYVEADLAQAAGLTLDTIAGASIREGPQQTTFTAIQADGLQLDILGITAVQEPGTPAAAIAPNPNGRGGFTAWSVWLLVGVVVAGAGTTTGLSAKRQSMRQLAQDIHDAHMAGFDDFVLDNAARLLGHHLYSAEALSALVTTSLRHESPDAVRSRVQGLGAHIDDAMKELVETVLAHRERRSDAAEAGLARLQELSPELVRIAARLIPPPEDDLADVA